MVSGEHEVKPRVSEKRVLRPCKGANPKTDSLRIAVAIREEYRPFARCNAFDAGGARREMRNQRPLRAKLGSWRVFSRASDFGGIAKSSSSFMGGDFQGLRVAFFIGRLKLIRVSSPHQSLPTIPTSPAAARSSASRTPAPHRARRACRARDYADAPAPHSPSKRVHDRRVSPASQARAESNPRW